MKRRPPESTHPVVTVQVRREDEDGSEETRTWLGECEDEGNHRSIKTLQATFLLQGQDDDEEPLNLLVSSNILFLNSSMRVVPQLDKICVQNQFAVSAPINACVTSRSCSMVDPNYPLAGK